MKNPIYLEPLASFLEHNSEHQIAIREQDNEISYRELNRNVKKLAANLVPYEKVALLLPQGAKAYTGMLGSLYAGTYYCPLNTELPENRLKHILEQFEPDVLVYSAESASLAEKLAVDYSGLDIDNLNSAPLDKPQSPHKLAYVIFTSGSTGVPKGVMVGSQGLSNYIQWSKKSLEINHTSIVSQHPNIGFDLSVLDIYATLSAGGTLVPITGMKYRTMPALAIKEHQITHWISVPSLIDLIARGKQLSLISSLEKMLFCGEPLFEYQLDMLFTNHPKLEIINTYGPTEATVSCTQVNLSMENYKLHCHQSRVTIGEAIEGISLSIKGIEEGELLISGEQVAYGYWRDNEKTSNHFQINGKIPRTYLTGDQVYSHRDKLYFSARIDRQIKINGYRVELSEIDCALHKLGYLSCITIFKEKKIYSFIETQTSIDKEAIRKNLYQELPSYMVPTDIFTIDSLPKNKNDKINAKELNVI